jgi:hypothetical protein
MADLKISQLNPATTPLAGTEVLPIVQSGSTVKVSVANLTAGRAVSATQMTLTTGNLIVASGQGIDFSATPGTGTSELLADYEEGTFTATLTCGTSGTITVNSSFNTLAYTKIGRVVHVQGGIRVSAVSSPTGAVILNLPFTSANLTQEAGLAVGIAIGTSIGVYSQPFGMYVIEGGTDAYIQYMNLGSRASVQGTDFSGDEEIQFGFSYIAA